MSVYETILKRRTIRKYKPVPISRDILDRMMEAARLAPSAANMQPLKYVVVDEPAQVKEVFKHVKWAGYITPAGDPGPGEEPVAFIAVLVDTEVRKSGYELDIGAAVQSIMLVAQEEGIGTCWMGAIDREEICRALGISSRYLLNTVVAMGYPAESSQVEEEKGSIRYWKDEKGNYHIPKRKLQDIVFYNKADE